MMAEKPGIVPLRPLQLGDIFNGTFALFRFNPATVLGIALIIQVVAFVLGFAGGKLVWGPLFEVLADTLPIEALDVITSLMGTLTDQIGAALTSGLLAVAIAHAVLGRKLSIGQTWQLSARRIIGYILGQFLLLLVLVLPVVLAIGLAVLLALNSNGAEDSWLAILLPVLGLSLVWALFAFVISIRLGFLAPVMMLEGLGISAAFKRSWRLTGPDFWRILGITILSGLMVAALGGIIGAPLGLLTGAGAGIGADPEGTALTSTALATVVVGVLAAPFSAGVSCLLYVDQRIRQEGLDIALSSSLADGRDPWATR